jgi:hypothetical protein
VSGRIHVCMYAYTNNCYNYNTKQRYKYTYSIFEECLLSFSAKFRV